MYSLLDVAKDGAADVVNIKVPGYIDEDDMTTLMMTRLTILTIMVLPLLSTIR